MAIHRMLLTSAVLLLPAAAAANIPFDIKAERVTFSPPVASGPVLEGAVLTIGCEWLALPGPLPAISSAVVAAKQFTFGGVIRIDGQIIGQISNTLSGASKLPHKGQSTTVTWKVSGAGKRTVSCELSPQEPQMLRNNQPNWVSASITVAIAPGSSTAKRLGRALGGDTRTPGTQKSASTATQPAGQTAGPASGPPLASDKIRGCRTSLTARVDVEPGQLLPPTYGPADMAVTKLTLYLQSSEAAGNSILCRYGSNKKDVSSLVITVPCPNASPQPTPHSYFCAK